MLLHVAKCFHISNEFYSSLQLRFCLESNKLSFASLEVQSCKSVYRSIKCLDHAFVEGGKLRFPEKKMSKGCSIMTSSKALDRDFVCQFWTYFNNYKWFNNTNDELENSGDKLKILV